MTPMMILAAALAFIAVLAAASAFAPAKADGRALKRLKEGGASKSRTKRTGLEASAAKRRQSTQEALKTLSAQQKQTRQRLLSVKGKIAQAGLSLTETVYWLGAIGLGLVLAFIGYLVQGSFIGAAAGLFVGAFGLPRWVLGMLIGRRQKRFTNQLADAIDMIVRGVKSGLPLNQCLQMIAAESPEPLRKEFRTLVDGQAMGVPFDANLNKLYERMPLPEVNFFNIVLIIQQKTGGNLSESLGNLSGVLRARKLMREKVKAMSSEAKASASIIGSLPFIVMILVYLVRPEYIMLLFTEPTGHIILAGSACMYATGIFVMRKMISFPI